MTLRWGQASGTDQLNIFTAQTNEEFSVLGEVYDKLFSSSPVQPGNVFCWICDSYFTTIDANGNEHFLVELRQNLRFQDGASMTAWDVKFSLLNLRDHPSAAGRNLFNLLNIQVMD